jgi:3,4-dihydroxy 2-butanone 4-phosphate synthase / GTP cyclohydrolase II
VEPISIAPLPTNEAYLRTKRDRMGHRLLLDTDHGASA